MKDEIKKVPKIYIIVLNYNGKDCLPNTLKGVFGLPYNNFELVLVDNNSSDGSREIVRKCFPKTTMIVNSENIGFAAGMNVGIRYALERAADYVLLLNYDVLIKEDFLSPLVEQMEKDPAIGIGSPIIFSYDEKIWFSGGKINWWRMRTAHKTNNLKNNYFGSDYLSGCALMIRAKVFRETGLLDEDYFLYYEDAAFSLETKKAGYKLLVCPTSHLVHLEKSRDDSERKTYWLVLSALIFFKKNTPFFWRIWVTPFLTMRRIKNWLNIKSKKGNSSEIVRKAYLDFYHVK